jgi:hypothetical protein
MIYKALITFYIYLFYHIKDSQKSNSFRNIEWKQFITIEWNIYTFIISFSLNYQLIIYLEFNKDDHNLYGIYFKSFYL